MKPLIPWRPSILGTVALSSALVVACSTAATPTPTRTLPTPTIAAATTAAPAVNPTSAPPSGATGAVAPTASPTPAPAVTPLPSGIVSARNDVTLVVGGEPAHVNPFLSGAGIPDASFRDNVVDPLAWQSGDDQHIVPTTATTGWQQIAPNQWRFTLRQGVKFQDGEPCNAQAAVPSLQFQGEPGNGTTSNPYTGNYTARAVDDYNVDIICEQACPIFPNTSFFVNFVSPNFLATNPPDEPTQTTVSFGPYKIVEWEPGVAITEEAYDGYTPIGDHYEFQKPYIKKPSGSGATSQPWPGP